MSISARTRTIGFLVVLSLMPTAITIYALADRADLFLVEMTQERALVVAARDLERAVIDAETGQRAYLISGAPEYLTEYRTRHAEAKAAIARLAGLSRTYSVEPRRTAEIIRPANAALALLQRLPEQGHDEALEVVRSQLGRFATQELRQAVTNLTMTQEEQFNDGAADVSGILFWARLLAMGGSLLSGIAILFSLRLLTKHVRGSLKALLSAMESTDDRGIPDATTARLTGAFKELGDTYNDMCARVRREVARRDDAEAQIALLLDRSDHELASRQHTTQILSQVSHRLPACIDQEELVVLAERFIPQLFDMGGGALYFLNNSTTVLHQVAVWGDAQLIATEFAPSKCWGLRRGQQHSVRDVNADITCAHVHCEDIVGYTCMPLIAQGDTVGLLYLESSRSSGDEQMIKRELEDMRLLCEGLALALVNLRLRESLRHQSLRDPLTGLYNRRYLQETMELEIARSARSDMPMSIVMIDVDHFKRINDTLGHDTGDLVLRRVAAAIQNQIRAGDIACRYGGEEFLVLLPETPHETALERAEALRSEISAMRVYGSNQEIPQITASFGVSTAGCGNGGSGDIIRSADTALYRAKQTGRNRVCSDIADVSTELAIA